MSSECHSVNEPMRMFPEGTTGPIFIRTIDLCGTDEGGPDRGLITREVVRAAKVNQSQGNSTELCDFHPQLVAAIQVGTHCLAVPEDVYI